MPHFEPGLSFTGAVWMAFFFAILVIIALGIVFDEGSAFVFALIIVVVAFRAASLTPRAISLRETVRTRDEQWITLTSGVLATEHHRFPVEGVSFHHEFDDNGDRVVVADLQDGTRQAIAQTLELQEAESLVQILSGWPNHVVE